MKEGEHLIGWLFAANENLYKKGTWDLPAQVLISFAGPRNASPEQLEEIANRMHGLKTAEALNDAEELVAQVFVDEKFRGDARFLLPVAFTNGLKVYHAQVWMHRDLLPEGRITIPYIHCKAIPGGQGPVFMVPYPDEV